MAEQQALPPVARAIPQLGTPPPTAANANGQRDEKRSASKTVTDTIIGARRTSNKSTSLCLLAVSSGRLRYEQDWHSLARRAAVKALLQTVRHISAHHEVRKSPRLHCRVCLEDIGWCLSGAGCRPTLLGGVLKVDRFVTVITAILSCRPSYPG